MKLSIGDKAPSFSIPSNGGNIVSLADYKGQYLALYFYPKDDTPGCTTEAIEFSAKQAGFANLKCQILGISKDSVAKHDKFIAKHDLTVPLGSDADGTMVEAYGVWVEKNMYGKKYMGIERATFLIDPTGTIIEIWRKVRVKDHVETVFSAISEVSQKAE